MKKENLLIIISNENSEAIMKFPLLYGGVSIPRGYWKRVHIMFWGPSIKTLVKEEQIQEKVKQMLNDGVEFSSCIVCAEDYNAVEDLEKIGVVCNHTGELLNEALQNDDIWSTLTI